MKLDDKTRDLVHEFINANGEHFSIKQVGPKIPRGAMHVGNQEYTIEITHLRTGVKVVIPPDSIRSSIARYELALAMFAIPVTLFNWDPETLR